MIQDKHEFVGKIWKFGPNINTDVLCPLEAFFLPVEEQVKYLFKPVRPGWPEATSPGDIVVAGRNFGQGSGRPAAMSFRLLGISCLVADSVNGLFFRNSVNFGFWTLECPGVHDAFEEGDIAQVNLAAFTVRNQRSGQTLQAKKIPEQLQQTIRAGGLYAQLEAEGYLAPLPKKASNTGTRDSNRPAPQQ